MIHFRTLIANLAMKYPKLYILVVNVETISVYLFAKVLFFVQNSLP